MKTIALFLVGFSAAMAAERAVIPNCCSSTSSSISLYSPKTKAVTHTFELNSSVSSSAISREGTEDYLVVGDSQPGTTTGLARLNLKDGNLSAVVSLPPALSFSLAASPSAPVFYLLYSDTSAILHLVRYSAELAVLNQVTLPPAVLNILFVSPKGDRIYLVTGLSAQGVIEVDATTLQTTRTLLPGMPTFGLAETGDESTLFVHSAPTYDVPGTIYVAAVVTGEVTEAVPLTGIVNSFTAAPNGSELFIINQTSVTTIAIPSQQAITYSANPNFGLGPAAGFSPDGGTLYLNSGGGFTEFNIVSGSFTVVQTPWTETLQIAANGRIVLQDGSLPGIVTGPVPSLTAALTFAGNATAAAWDEVSDSIYLANSGVVQVLDDKTFQPKGQLTFSQGFDAQMLALGGGYLYVGTAIGGEENGPATILKFDPSTLVQLATFNLPPNFGANVPEVGNGFVSPDGSKLYVEYIYTQAVGPELARETEQAPSSSETQGENPFGIAVFDTASGAMLNNFPLTTPSAFALGKDGTTGYVSSISGIYGNTASILQLDLTSGAVINSVVLYTGPPFNAPQVGGPLLSPDGSMLLAEIDSKQLVIIDPATLAFKKSAALPLIALLAITSDGHYLYGAEQGASLVVVDLTTLQVVSTQPASQPFSTVALII